MIVDFLVIDEVDNRFAASENAADLFGKIFEQIFRNRLQNKLPVIMCSNSPNPIEMFTGSFKTSIDSLMSSMKMIVATGNDFRPNEVVEREIRKICEKEGSVLVVFGDVGGVYKGKYGISITSIDGKKRIGEFLCDNQTLIKPRIMHIASLNNNRLTIEAAK